MAEEIELRLELTAEAAEALDSAELFSGKPVISAQHAIYFDTPEHHLDKAGYLLRVRQDGGTRVQTIKAAGAAAAGMFVRPEWEREIEDDAPVLDDTTPLPAVLGAKVADIKPLFTVKNERRVWIDGGVEIALDRGRIISGERELPLREVELAVKDGNCAAPFALARRIDALVPVHLGVLSKAERGYRLLGPAPIATQAGVVKLTESMTAARAFQEIARDALRHFRLNVPLILNHQDAAAVHQARVAIRRLRSAISIHKPMLDDDRAEYLNAELRWLAGELGAARDFDVLIERAGDGVIRDRLLAARTEAYANAIGILQSDRARALMIDSVEWIAIGGWLSSPRGRDLRELPAREFAAKALDRFRRKVKKGGRDLEELDDESRHEVRKAAKKLRYAAEFFAALHERNRERRRHKKFLSALKTLQDELGALNDLATAPAVLVRLGLADDPGAKALFAADGKANLLKTSADAYDDLVDAKRFWR